MRRRQRRRGFKHQFIRAYALGAPLVITGILLCCTIIGIPIGLLLIVLGSLPAYRAYRRFFDERVATTLLAKEDTRRVRKEELEVIDWNKYNSDAATDYYGNNLN